MQRQPTRAGAPTGDVSPAGGSTRGSVGAESGERGATQDFAQREPTQPAGGDGPTESPTGDLQQHTATVGGGTDQGGSKVAW